MADTGSSSRNTGDIESAVRNLLRCIGCERDTRPVPQQNAAQPSPSGPSSSSPARPITVQQEMQRSFPSLFSGGLKRKRKSADPPRKSFIRFSEFQFCLQAKNMDRTPQDEAILLQAGLGRRTINIPDDADHMKIRELLCEQYPKMEALKGGWLLKKASGGSGQRKTTPLPQGSEGYTAKILKMSSCNGKNVIYIVPLQEQIDTEPLPFDAPEFEKMPKNNCMSCGKLIPLPLIQIHIQKCGDLKSDRENQMNTVEDDNDEFNVDACPICGQDFPAEDLAYHASSCGERFPEINSPSTTCASSTAASTSSSVPCLDILVPSQTTEVEDCAWKTKADPDVAADLYRKQLFQAKEDEPTLRFKLDITEEVEDQEARILSFYKAPNTDWNRPFQVKLQGDVAVGDGVNRHFFSMVMNKLQHGFKLDLGDSCNTVLFVGEPDHFVPSASQVLTQNEMFRVAGRIIGHSFLHGGPRLTGLSPSIVQALLTDSPHTVTIMLEDVPDIDIRETIRPLYEVSELTEDAQSAVNNLALSWDLPILTKRNRTWLLQNLLQHAVLGRTSRQLQQLKLGLRETGTWTLLESRPDTVSSVFPPQAAAECNAEVVLDHIKWPEEQQMDVDDGSGCSVENKCRILGYLRQFIIKVSQEHLKELVKFWVGWETPVAEMKVEVVTAEFPTASTCFCTLHLPGSYMSYREFSSNLLNCISHNDTGFGLL